MKTTTPRAVTKALGFRGKKSDRWWTKDSAHGVRYQCATCGKITLGMHGTDDPRMHWQTCPRLDRGAVGHDTRAAASTRPRSTPKPRTPMAGRSTAAEDENAQLRILCMAQAEQISDLQAVASGTSRPRAIPPDHRWSAEPPAAEVLTKHPWWWNRSPDGELRIVRADARAFDPADWSGEWAACMTPDDVTVRVSRIAEAGRRLVMSHAAELRAAREALQAVGSTSAGSVAKGIRLLAAERDETRQDAPIAVPGCSPVATSPRLDP